eukprot:6181984-Pleurochrysis_carterae.AAC.1
MGLFAAVRSLRVRERDGADAFHPSLRSPPAGALPARGAHALQAHALVPDRVRRRVRTCVDKSVR